ncbi:Secreted RxLR effector peptide protein [Phytophthora palmivora]|uniref:Secreted RxLR effector peptide protein n=1 Tax=Phytophthora palmivora TaxID=4796 RepID=A0A2P4XMR7_9STRA|nr:Secreted RxLR effector peptide protein [Phytophthora palmivora]
MHFAILLVIIFVKCVSGLDKNDCKPYSNDQNTIAFNGVSSPRRRKGSITTETQFIANDEGSERGLNDSPLTSTFKKSPDIAHVLEKTPTSLARNPSVIKILKANPSYGKTMSTDSVLLHTLEKNPALARPFEDPKCSKQLESLRSNDNVIDDITNNPALSNLKTMLSRNPSDLTEPKARKIGLYASKSTSFRWIDDEEGLILAYGVLIIAVNVILAIVARSKKRHGQRNYFVDDRDACGYGNSAGSKHQLNSTVWINDCSANNASGQLQPTTRQRKETRT